MKDYPHENIFICVLSITESKCDFVIGYIYLVDTIKYSHPEEMLFATRP